MQRNVLPVIASLLIIVSCTSREAALDGGSSEVLAAQSAYKQAIEAENEGGLLALLSPSSDSAPFYFTDGTGQLGADGYRSWFAQCDSIRLTYAKLNAHMSPAGDAAVVSYLEDGREVCGGKPEVWASRRATVVWERVDGKWRIVHGHWSDVVAATTAKK